MAEVAGPTGPTRAQVEAAFRAEAGRATATVARLLGDLGAAEDAVQEAFLAALQTWPTAGVPRRPGAWITTVARNRGRDRARREARRPAKELDAVAGLPAPGEPLVHPVLDDQLQLLFTCCHPALGVDVQVPLTLRFVCGLPTAAISRLLLQPEATITKRLQRAKAKIRAAAIPLRVPPPELLDERVDGVLACTYLVFTEGYSATGGGALVRAELCDEAIRLAELLVRLLPGDPAARALLALVLLQDSRRAARLDASGDIVLLEHQDRSAWDQQRIAAGLDHLQRVGPGPGRGQHYALQAEIAAAHATAATWAGTDWPRIAAAYEQLAELTGSPIVELNRAVAIAHVDGPAAGLAILARLDGDPRLARNHHLPAAQGALLRRLGRRAESRAAYERALALVRTEPERRLLAGQLDAPP